MEDLIAIQGKSVAELREIAKVLGITEEKLSKKELVARISSIGADDTTADVSEEVAVATAEVAPSAPQKRKRARLGSVKVTVAQKENTEERVEDTKPAAKSDINEKSEEIVENTVESVPATPANEEVAEKEVAAQPKKRGRKPKSTAESTAP
ncbi:MAG: hypothetical protein IKY24_00170, partial [Alistipes sp.]|nr:hypothetical protein [Alistipes sp.]